jgi:hypothetical protein
MNLSDAGQQTAAKALRRDTHAFSAEEMAGIGVETGDINVPSQRDDSGREGDGEESRYASRRRRPIAHTTTRTNNRFESLTDKTVEYVISDSDDDGGPYKDGASQAAHDNKRRRIEPEVRPGQARRESKRSYWASKVRPE